MWIFALRIWKFEIKEWYSREVIWRNAGAPIGWRLRRGRGQSGAWVRLGDTIITTLSSRPKRILLSNTHTLDILFSNMHSESGMVSLCDEKCDVWGATRRALLSPRKDLLYRIASFHPGKKFLIILFSSVFLFWFGGASRLSSRRDFPCNRAVCQSPLLPALLLGVSARLLLVVMRERKWRREKRVKQRRTFRHWQPRRGTVWSGSTGRNCRPMHSQ